jgi:hypothetical protein
MICMNYRGKMWSWVKSSRVWKRGIRSLDTSLGRRSYTYYTHKTGQDRKIVLPIFDFFYSSPMGGTTEEAVAGQCVCAEGGPQE